MQLLQPSEHPLVQSNPCLRKIMGFTHKPDRAWRGLAAGHMKAQYRPHLGPRLQFGHPFLVPTSFDRTVFQPVVLAGGTRSHSYVENLGGGGEPVDMIWQCSSLALQKRHSLVKQRTEQSGVISCGNDGPPRKNCLCN